MSKHMLSTLAFYGNQTHHKPRLQYIPKAGVLPVFLKKDATSIKDLWFCMDSSKAHEDGLQIPKGQRKIQRRKNDRLIWTNPKGDEWERAEKKESMLSGAIRETAEEVGIKRKDYRFLFELGKQDYKSFQSGEKKPVFLFAGVVPQKTAHGRYGRWVKYEEAIQKLRSDHAEILKAVAPDIFRNVQKFTAEHSRGKDR